MVCLKLSFGSYLFGWASLDNVNWVDDVTQTLWHFSAVSVADDGVKEDFLKRGIPSQLLTQHHHAGHPKEEDVVTRLHQGQWVVSVSWSDMNNIIKVGAVWQGGQAGTQTFAIFGSIKTSLFSLNTQLKFDSKFARGVGWLFL